MSYALGIDLGTTYSAAAVFRDGRAEIASLGNRAASVPSVVFLREDEAILTGEAANRRAMTEPDRVAREFKRRVGDTTPVFVGGTPYSAEALMAKLLHWIAEAVAEREGGPPSQIAISHPANWGAFKIDLLRQAVRMADLGEVTLLTEPEAAAIHYASQERVDVGAVVAVYDLGGGTFDAAVLRKTSDGWEVMGQPEGIERLGGIDFDAAVFAHVQRALGGSIEDLDTEDPATIAAVSRLKQDCIDAKEALSTDTDTSIPVLLPNLQTEVRLTRTEFETMIRPSLSDSIDALRRALRSAGIEPEDVSAVLLVGGSSRIPLVSQLVSAELGRPVAVDAHPKHAIPLGAAIRAARDGGMLGKEETAATVEHVEIDGAPGPAGASGVAVGAALAGGGDTAPAADSASPGAETPEPVAAAAGPPDGVEVAEPRGAPVAPEPAVPAQPAMPPVGPDYVEPEAPSGNGGSKAPWLIGAGAAVVVAAVVIVFLALGGGGGDDTAEPAATGAGQSEDTSPDTSVDTTTTSESTTTAASGPTPTPCPGGDKTACITGIEVDADGTLLVDWETTGFSADKASEHVHFFFPTAVNGDFVNAGTGGCCPGEWILWGEEDGHPFDGYTVDDANNFGATQICSLVADAGHAVTVDTGNCIDIPSGPEPTGPYDSGY
ncbi:MAG: Chaperone protein DnaK [Acidimicrobiales bacterium]|nr:MAG: Hsp70 family protein [Actinomycetota bacterium]MBV6508438.1 Chaperone protein DnaK [Acidimicrobiales bacterium]RIK04755.1 MAG: hypothetical protein DCC48_11930 [Acidobacteriota bacterium]